MKDTKVLFSTTLIGLILFPIAVILVAAVLGSVNVVATATVGSISASWQVLVYWLFRLGYFFGVGFAVGRRVKAGKVWRAATGGMILASVLMVIETAIGGSLMGPAHDHQAWNVPAMVRHLFSLAYVMVGLGLQTAAASLGGLVSLRGQVTEGCERGT